MFTDPKIRWDKFQSEHSNWKTSLATGRLTGM